MNSEPCFYRIPIVIPVVLSEMVFVFSYIELNSIDYKFEFPFDIEPCAI